MVVIRGFFLLVALAAIMVVMSLNLDFSMMNNKAGIAFLGAVFFMLWVMSIMPARAAPAKDKN